MHLAEHVVTPDSLQRWHRQLVAEWMCGRRSVYRRQVLAEIRRLVIRMAEENATWGYTRMQGAVTNQGHRVGAIDDSAHSRGGRCPVWS
jgi:putative transposase